MLKKEELSNPNSCLNRAHDEEPVFVLLGRDLATPHAVRQWTMKRVDLGKNMFGDAQIVEALQLANIIEGSHIAAKLVRPPESNYFAPISQLITVDGFKCSKRCGSVHFHCPKCGNEGSLNPEEATSIFSVTCADDRNYVFLVDQRHLVRGPQKVI